MSWDFEERLKYPETAEYLEKLVTSEKTEVDLGFAAAVEFNYRFYKKKKSETEAVPGMLFTKNKERMIETKSDLKFKIGDIIRVDLDRQYRITDIDYVLTDEEDYVFKNQAWPGLKDDLKVKILTLK